VTRKRRKPQASQEEKSRGPYEIRQSALSVLHSQDTEIVVAGPAGTGKSLVCCLKLHCVCERVPGVRCLMVRKTRESLTEAALVTFENKILPVDHASLANGGQRRVRQAYHYPNGSQITLGGLDKPQKVMSTEYDIIYVQEAIELNEADWEALLTRLRHGKIPYQQLLADTNPDSPIHWLKRRVDAGKCRMIESRHEDNPLLYKLGEWTPAGKSYLAKLDSLTGPRKLRLRFGRWVQSEGVVYEGWSRATHLINRFHVPLDWERFLSIDFGYTNAFVCQFWCKDHDGRLYRYREIYHTKKLVEDHAKRILELIDLEAKALSYRQNPKLPIENIRSRIMPQMAICDHDAEDRATLAKYLHIPIVPARKEIRPGIEAVQARMRDAGDGKPRIFLMHDSLDQRDAWLVECKKPCCTEEEIDSYIWNEEKDVPVDEDNHGVDAMRYMISQFDLFGKGFEAPSSAPAAERKPPEQPFRLDGNSARPSRLFGR
jgi:PBSX family phage terminase large subunit